MSLNLLTLQALNYQTISYQGKKILHKAIMFFS